MDENHGIDESRFERVYADINRLDQLRVSETESNEKLTVERVRRLDERLNAQETAVSAALAAAEKAVAAALSASDKAVTKAEIAQAKVNECVTPETPVLCADLVWRPAGELKPGDTIVGLDEDSPSSRGRRFRSATVLANSPARAKIVEVATSKGSMRCTLNHPWLSRKHAKAWNGWQWKHAADLRPGDEVLQPLDVWETDDSWWGGWLAGLYDGEGCLSVGRGRVQLTISQRVSPTAETILRVAEDKIGKEEVRAYIFRSKRWQPRQDVFVCSRPSILKTLGSIRPTRLLADAEKAWVGAVVASHGRAVTVTSVKPIGIGDIAELSTTTKTYLAGGFAAHNTQNEFRGSLRDQAATQMPRSEAENVFRELRALIAAQAKDTTDLRSRIDIGPPSLSVLQARSDNQQGRQQGVQSLTTNAYGLLLAIAAIAGLIGHYIY